jgi:hypothetical protein
MIEYVRKILAGQFEAALCIMNDCLTKCPPAHWDGMVGKYPFWLVAYHTLCFTDLYLSPSEAAFEFREVHPCGWKEFNEEYPSRRFEQNELVAYLAICRTNAVETIARETAESLEAPAGFDWLSNLSRGELHLYNMRHVQHHTGQLSAYLRRADESLRDPQAVRWVSTGWK